MKKLKILLLAVATVITLVGCNNNKTVEENSLIIADTYKLVEHELGGDSKSGYVLIDKEQINDSIILELSKINNEKGYNFLTVDFGDSTGLTFVGEVLFRYSNLNDEYKPIGTDLGEGTVENGKIVYDAVDETGHLNIGQDKGNK